MTVMQEAFAKAETLAAANRAPVTMKERVWQHIKKHPGCTERSLESVFKGVVGHASISFHLRDMLDRGMLEVKKSNLKRQMGFAMVADNTYYYHAIGHEYSVKPKKFVSNKPAKSVKKANTKKEPVEKVIAEEASTKAIEQALTKIENSKPATFDIDNMKVKDARELFNSLKAIFGS